MLLVPLLITHCALCLKGKTAAQLPAPHQHDKPTLCEWSLYTYNLMYYGVVNEPNKIVYGGVRVVATAPYIRASTAASPMWQSTCGVAVLLQNYCSPASHPIRSAQPLTSETQSARQNVCAMRPCIKPLHSLYTRNVTTNIQLYHHPHIYIEPNPTAPSHIAKTCLFYTRMHNGKRRRVFTITQTWEEWIICEFK